MSAVESILTLDKLRQNVAVKERLLAQGNHYPTVSMRKTASVPNFSQVSVNCNFHYLYVPVQNEGYSLTQLCTVSLKNKRINNE